VSIPPVDTMPPLVRRRARASPCAPAPGRRPGAAGRGRLAQLIVATRGDAGQGVVGQTPPRAPGHPFSALRQCRLRRRRPWDGGRTVRHDRDLAIARRVRWDEGEHASWSACSALVAMVEAASLGQLLELLVELPDLPGEPALVAVVTLGAAAIIGSGFVVLVERAVSDGERGWAPGEARARV